MTILNSTQAYPIKEETYSCGKCDGGIKILDEDDFLWYLKTEDWDKRGIEELMAVIEKYLETGGIDCPCCGGKGTITERW